MKIIHSPQSTVRSYKLTAFFLVTFIISGFAAFSQTTAIPDDNFEQILIDFGIDTNGKNNTILNSDAAAVVSLTIIAKGIGNLSGIEAFTSLTELYCSSNPLTNLNVSANTALTRLFCASNFRLTILNVQNGNNTSLFVNASNSPNLTCIQVDDANNTPSSWTKDATAVYSEDCSTLNSEDFKLAGISISPNPTSGILNIAIVEKAGYRLLNIRGQILKKGTLATGEGKINLLSLSKGIYFLNINTGKGSFTKK